MNTSNLDPTQFKEYEDKVYNAKRARAKANAELAVAEAEYSTAIAQATGARAHNIELTTTGPCRKPIMHCVYNLRSSRMPLCVFCGSPKYGDY